MADELAVIVGAGGHARVVAEALRPGAVSGHLTPSPDDQTDTTLLGPRLGDDSHIDDLASAGHVFVIGLGYVNGDGARIRADVVERLAKTKLLTVLHPSSNVSPSAAIGDGSFVAVGAIVGTNARLARAAIVNTGAVVDHDCHIGANAHIGPGAVLSGGVSIGDHTLIGVGATIVQGVSIGANVVVGAGAVVINDLADGVTAVGVPALPRGSRR